MDDPTIALVCLALAAYLAIAGFLAIGKPLHCRCPLNRLEHLPAERRMECRDCGRLWNIKLGDWRWCGPDVKRLDERHIATPADGPSCMPNYRPWYVRWRSAASYVGQGIRLAWREL